MVRAVVEDAPLHTRHTGRVHPPDRSGRSGCRQGRTGPRNSESRASVFVAARGQAPERIEDLAAHVAIGELQVAVAPELVVVIAATPLRAGGRRLEGEADGGAQTSGVIRDVLNA